MSDLLFDSMYPEWVQELSDMFWTPVLVAQRAAQLLVSEAGDKILDIGSGVGKFCLVGAASTSGIFHGIEQRGELVEVATEVALRHSWTQEQIAFKHGNMSEEDWAAYQGVYLFNPFQEQTAGPWCQIDTKIKYSRGIQEAYIELVVQKLSTLRLGTRVATYFGFGAHMPAGYTKISYEQFDKGPLEVWLREA